MHPEESPRSFTPQKIGKRPSARGAKSVGKGAFPPFFNEGTTSSDPQNLPPSISPRNTRNKTNSPNPWSPSVKIFSPENPVSSTSNSDEDIALPSNTGSSGLPANLPLAKNKKSKKKKIFLGITAVFFTCLFCVGGWGFFLYNLGSEKMHTIDALSQKADTPGTTYLIAGSDQRQSTKDKDPTVGKRADTIMLLHLPDTGTPALISIPRDTYANIPGHGGNKINSSFSIGGAKLLVETVEELTGMKVDHYIEIGMDGVIELTDAVGGINACYDRKVSDEYSGLIWSPGCHDIDGKTALAFSRMRYQDPEGDIGRAKRQRQVVSKILTKAISKETFFDLAKQKRLVEAGASILTVDKSDSLWDIGMSALALKKAIGADGVTGTPPISKLNYHARGMTGAAVLLDPKRIADFWKDLQQGTLNPEKYETIQKSTK